MNTNEFRVSACAAMILAAVGSACAQTQVTLIAMDSKCIDVDGDNLNDNRLRAYTATSINPAPGYQRLMGLLKFDVSSIPDGVTILEMELTTFHEMGFSNPHQDPSVRIYRYGDHTWARSSSTNPFNGFGAALTPEVTGFPTGDLVPVLWTLDATAADWSDDLLADRISLGMFNERLTYSYVYFYGSGPTGRPPELKITYGDLCYADCDTSTGVGVLDIFDFLCFGNRFSAGDPYACDCDTSTGMMVCDIFDFLCFGNAFNAGCP